MMSLWITPSKGPVLIRTVYMVDDGLVRVDVTGLPKFGDWRLLRSYDGITWICVGWESGWPAWRDPAEPSVLDDAPWLDRPFQYRVDLREGQRGKQLFYSEVIPVLDP